MAGVGKQYVFHGAYTSRARAEAKARVRDGRVKAVTIYGRRRYAVLTARRGRSLGGVRF